MYPETEYLLPNLRQFYFIEDSSHISTQEIELWYDWNDC